MDNWAFFEEKYGPAFGKGAHCRVYRKGNLAVKVYNEGTRFVYVMREAYALAMVESRGIPTSNLQAVYKEQGHVVMEMDYVEGKELIKDVEACIARGDTAALNRHLQSVADIQYRMHQSDAYGQISTHGLYRSIISNSDLFSAPQKEKLLALLNTLPDGKSLCHNDYHPSNILYDGTRYIVIDWDSVSIGDPAGDIAHSYILMLLGGKALADAYLAIYLEKSGMDPARVTPWLSFHAMFLYPTIAKNEKFASKFHDIFAPYIEGLL